MSSGDAPAPPRKGGLSLYANLLDPKASTISSGPVTYTQANNTDQDDTASKKPQMNAAFLRFQPTKRPQAQQTRAKPKPGFSKVPSSSGVGGTSSPDPAIAKTSVAPQSTQASHPSIVKSSIADWTGTNDDDDDVNGFYGGGGEKRQRGGRKKRKKNHQEERVVVQNWDDIYDPSRPNNYEDYKHSDEKWAEIREWKDRLYAHRYAREKVEEDEEMASDRSEEDRPVVRNNMFAPPTGPYSFAPPASFDNDDDQARTTTSSPRPAPPPADINMDETADEAYDRRAQLTSMMQASSGTTDTRIAPPPADIEQSSQVPPHPPMSAAPASSISRAPVRYSLPMPSSELPSTEAELQAALSGTASDVPSTVKDEAATPERGDAESPAPRSLAPGQKGFAQRLMSKMGWTKGSGLGASGTGLVAPLRVQMDKRKKQSNQDGKGGYVGPQTARIVGGKTGADQKKKKVKKEDNEQEEEEEEVEEDKTPAISEVVVMKGMVDGLDVAHELAEGTLMQEIGEECGEKYGRVERVFIHQHSAASSIPVFIKFTSQLSALRAVNALQGRVFNGNAITAGFYDSEKFEEGVYE